MSQQAQAERIHSDSVQDYEELRREIDGLSSLSGEAFSARRRELDENMDRIRARQDLAAKLNLISDRSGAPAATATEPEVVGGPVYLHSMGQGTQPVTSTSSAAGVSLDGAMGETEAQSFGPASFSGSTSEMQKMYFAAANVAGVRPQEFRTLEGDRRGLVNAHLYYSARLKNIGAGPMTAEEQRHAAAVEKKLFASSYVGRDGGYLTGVEIANETLLEVRDQVFIRALARVQRISTPELHMPSLNIKVSLKKARQLLGKVDGSDPITIRDAIGKEVFRPQTKMETIKLPWEMLRDSNADFVGAISQALADESFEDEEQEFLTGTGQGEPYGVLTSPLIPGENHTGASNADIQPEDIKTLPLKIRAAFSNTGVWMGHREFYLLVHTMRTEPDGAGSGDFLYRQGVAAGMPPTLDGRPTYMSEFFPDNITSGSAGDALALYGDWRRGYQIVDRDDLEIYMLNELYRTEGMIGIHVERRYDGAPIRLEAFITLDRT